MKRNNVNSNLLKQIAYLFYAMLHLNAVGLSTIADMEYMKRGGSKVAARTSVPAMEYIHVGVLGRCANYAPSVLLLRSLGTTTTLPRYY